MSALKDKIWRFLGDQMETFNSLVDVDPECIYHDDQVQIRKELVIPKTIEELLRGENVSPSGYLSFYNDFVCISACEKCSISAKAGFADLMKGQGSCAGCGMELEVTSFNRVMIDDVVAKVPLKVQYWPFSALAQIIDGAVYTVAIRRE
jgi:hypothetical protein